MSVELAKAYITIVPAYEKGIQKDITEQMVGIGNKSGAAGGEAMGKSMAGKLSGILGKVAVPAAIATAVVALGKAAYDLGKEFDAAYDIIRVGTGATGEAFEQLQKDTKAVLSSVPNTAEEVGQAIADLNTRLGISGEELQGLAQQYLEAGNILGTSVDISATTAAFNAFNISGEDASAALDDLFTVSQKTGIGINELANAVKSNAGAMQQLGFSFEETAAMAGMLDKVGIDASSTFSKMSKGLVTLAKDGEEPAEAFKRVTGEMQSLIEQGKDTEALNLASEIFGTKGAAQWVSAIKSGALATDELTAALEGNENAIINTADDTRDFAESWQILKNSVAVALEPLASGIFKGLGDTINEITSYIKEVASEIRDNLAPLFPQLEGGGISIADIISKTLIPVLKFVIDIISVIVIAIGTLVGHVASAISEIVAWFQSLPDKVSGLVQRMTEIGRNIVEGIKQGIREKASSIFDGLKSAISNGINWIKKLLGIASPSKTFKWIFEMVMEGGIQGIESKEDELRRTMVSAMGGTFTAGFNSVPYSLDSSSHAQNVYINGARLNDSQGIQEALISFLYDLQRLGVMEGAQA